MIVRHPYRRRFRKYCDGIVELIGDYGIGSADAMILNISLCSKIPPLLTADMELAEAAVTEAKGQKQIFVPDSLLASQM